MFKIACTISGLILASWFLLAQVPPDSTTGGTVHFAMKPSAIPLARLLVIPEKFDGKQVTTCGFLNRVGSRGVLYQSKFDWKHGLMLNAIAVEFEIERMTAFSYRGPVIMTGVFTLTAATDVIYQGKITVEEAIVPNATHRDQLADLADKTLEALGAVEEGIKNTISKENLIELRLLLSEIEAELRSCAKETTKRKPSVEVGTPDK